MTGAELRLYTRILTKSIHNYYNRFIYMLLMCCNTGL